MDFNGFALWLAVTAIILTLIVGIACAYFCWHCTQIAESIQCMAESIHRNAVIMYDFIAKHEHAPRRRGKPARTVIDLGRVPISRGVPLAVLDDEDDNQDA